MAQFRIRGFRNNGRQNKRNNKLNKFNTLIFDFFVCCQGSLFIRLKGGAITLVEIKEFGLDGSISFEKLALLITAIQTRTF